MPRRKNFLELSKSQKNRRIGLALHDIYSSFSANDDVETDITEEVIHDTSFSGCVSDSTSSIQMNYNFDSAPIEVGDDPFPSTFVSELNDISDVNPQESSSSVFEFEINRSSNDNLQEKLAQWICHFTISHSASNALINILHNVQSLEQLKQLPQDSRTLLCTPRKTTIRPVAPGKYFHYGLEKGLTDQLKTLIDKVSTQIQLNIHIDGLPLAKSSSSQLYPILGEIFPKVAEPFLIGIYHGYNKPADCNIFLREFIDEYNDLQREGFTCFNHTFTVKIRAILCDAPARSFVTYTKGHTGYYACSKCRVEGVWENNRVVFLEMSAPLRTDQNFLQRVDEEHHIGNSIFEETDIGMVSQFPLDYMHLVCLGVTKKILQAYIKGWRVNESNLLKFSSNMMDEISNQLRSMTEWIPSEFVRKTRGLDELDRWKATEFRLFLLYVGPLVFARYFTENHLVHFNTLHCAIRILCDETDCLENIECAQNMLNDFVTDCAELYGNHFVIYNVHNLIHLTNDVMNYGSLDAFSAFTFESHLHSLKKLLKKGEKPLQQLHKRICERASCSYQRKIKVFTQPEVSNYNKKRTEEKGVCSYNTVHYKTFILSASQDCDRFCFVTNHYDVLRIKNIFILNNKIMIRGRTLINPVGLRNYPINSTEMHIVSGNEWSSLIDFQVEDVIQKAVCLPYEESFCFFPLLHSSV